MNTVLTLCISFVNSVLVIAVTQLYFLYANDKETDAKPQFCSATQDVGQRVQILLLHSRMQPNKLRGKEDTTTILPFPTNDSTANVLAIS
jgi:hypothetical protein